MVGVKSGKGPARNPYKETVAKCKERKKGSEWMQGCQPCWKHSGPVRVMCCPKRVVVLELVPGAHKDERHKGVKRNDD